jgi:hypothetical protein
MQGRATVASKTHRAMGPPEGPREHCEQSRLGLALVPVQGSTKERRLEQIALGAPRRSAAARVRTPRTGPAAVAMATAPTAVAPLPETSQEG